MLVLVSDSDRRIQGGDEVYSKKSYMVYLVKSPQSGKPYDEWLCGGVLVTTLFILTSQICVNDVEYMYAIAGYAKYVPDSEIETDQCTKEKKKKVIYFCFPESTQIKNISGTKYERIDIALAKVESAYNLSDDTFKVLCSYIPTVIPINYEKRFQEPGIDAIVLGWGHKGYYRMPFDKKNHNQKMLQYAPVKITKNNICKRHYARYPLLNQTIDKFMICTMEDGGLNEEGDIIMSLPSSPIVECEVLRLSLRDNVRCNQFRAQNRAVLRSNQMSPDPEVEIKNRTLNQTSRSRRPLSGFCQNDHGGPLVTWVGSKEVLIGIASLFRVADDSKCIGPYLYTSTQRNSIFIDCIVTRYSDVPHNKSRRSICNSPPKKRGFRIVEKYISWTSEMKVISSSALPDTRPTKRYFVRGHEPLAVQNVGDKLNNDTKKTTRISKAFEELIKLEIFWKKYNSNNLTTTINGSPRLGVIKKKVIKLTTL
ncbi:hypothetical protein PYW07_010058 [Mythimna separata]|uniref:Peptidase S1 domain-containing protein n=1 Tax=Mythimna separata TaxID=271217 RepID=A0AAD8DQ05_MYTSE|nr:hypothetical protein PYW07_010058 [Mythimna separata]